MHRPGWVRATIGTAVLVVALASCGFGVTHPAVDVTDVSAQLTGAVHNTIAGPTDYWFEYGTTTGYTSKTSTRSVNVVNTDQGYPVTATVVALSEGTEYHERLCTRGADGRGVCGADQTFTTTTGRDSVTGQGSVFSLPGIGYAIGGDLDVSGTADGSNPIGSAATSPGSFYFRLANRGPLTCLRVNGNRATIGFLAEPPDVGLPPDTPAVPELVFIEDNGPTGDRFGSREAPEPVTSCPVPTDADFPSFTVGGQSIPPIVTSGDFVVHDHVSP